MSSRLDEFVRLVPDIKALTPVQRANVAKVLGVHESALETVHDYARRAAPPAPPGPGPQRLSDGEFNRLSMGERLDYARQFPQPQTGGGR